MTTPTPGPVPAAAVGPLHALASPPPPASWMPSRKVLTQFSANALTFAAALLVTKLGLKETATEAGTVSAVIGILAGGIAGYLVREIPRLEQDVKPEPAPKGM